METPMLRWESKEFAVNRMTVTILKTEHLEAEKHRLPDW